MDSKRTFVVDVILNNKPSAAYGYIPPGFLKQRSYFLERWRRRAHSLIVFLTATAHGCLHQRATIDSYATSFHYVIVVIIQRTVNRFVYSAYKKPQMPIAVAARTKSPSCLAQSS